MKPHDFLSEYDLQKLLEEVSFIRSKGTITYGDVLRLEAIFKLTKNYLDNKPRLRLVK